MYLGMEVGQIIHGNTFDLICLRSSLARLTKDKLKFFKTFLANKILNLKLEGTIFS